jgi:hypothetical protein
VIGGEYMYTFLDNKEKFSQEELSFMEDFSIGVEGLDFLKNLKILLTAKEDRNKVKDTTMDYSHLLPDWKFWNREPKIGKDKHKNRNKHQNKMSPSSIETIEKLVDLKLFYKLGHTATHNLEDNETEAKDRWRWFCVLERNLGNRDYRGELNTKFEGCQFIYNEFNKKVVLTDINKGTWDFRSPLRSVIDHFINDISPWLVWGNMGKDIASQAVMNKKDEELVDGAWLLYDKKIENLEQVQNRIYKIFKK